MRTALCFVTLMLASILCLGGQTTATIDKILLYDDGMLIYIYPTGGVVGAPSCHGSNGNYYSNSIARPMDKEYLAALMTVQARGATVWFYGKGVCQDQSVSETLSHSSVSQ